MFMYPVFGTEKGHIFRLLLLSRIHALRGELSLVMILWRI